MKLSFVVFLAILVFVRAYFTLWLHMLRDKLTVIIKD